MGALPWLWPVTHPAAMGATQMLDPPYRDTRTTDFTPGSAVDASHPHYTHHDLREGSG